MSSRDGARAEAYAAAHGIPRAHGSYEALLADDELDAVYIALPNALHFEWTMRALAAGKHVLVEKPFTRQPEQVDQAWGEAEKRGLVLVEGYMWRHSPQTQLVLSLLPELGELQAVHSWFFDPVLREHDVRFVPELGGGALLDLGCYCVGALRLVAGREPDELSGEALLGRGGVDERFTGTLRFGELTATFACGFHGKTNTLDVIGADGLLHVPHAFSDPDGVVARERRRASRRSGRRLSRAARRLLRRDPRRASTARRPSRHARPGGNAGRPAARSRNQRLTASRG